MPKNLILWVEKYLFYPNFFQKILAFLLLPFSFLYACIMFLRRRFARLEDFHMPIISVGNITLGGNGKTPLILALAKDKKNIAIILRGYGRKSSGMLVVSEFGRINVDISQAADEAMLYALSLKNAIVIVSEDRKIAIQKAKQMQVELIFLDDAFSKANIKKFDILLAPKEKLLPFCLPSGAFREPLSSLKYADLILHEDIDFTREVNIINPTKRMVLVTAIAKAWRLDRFLPEDLAGKFIFEDHHLFCEDELSKILLRTKATSLLTTTKDFTKMSNFSLPISLLDLNLNIKKDIHEKIEDYINSF